MNEIVNKFLLAGDKFIPEIHLCRAYSASAPLLKTKNGLKNLYKNEIQILLTEMSWINLVFNMIWLMVNQEI